MNEMVKSIDKFFDDLFLKKAPQLPKSAKDWIVKALPWIALIFGLLAVPGIIAGLGLTAFSAPFWVLTHGRSYVWLVAFVIGTIQTIMELVAVPHLFKKAKKGWMLLFWASLLGLVGAVVSVALGSLVFTLLGLYFLYQIKASYKQG